jgi:hypothetical protein
VGACGQRRAHLPDAVTGAGAAADQQDDGDGQLGGDITREAHVAAIL